MGYNPYELDIFLLVCIILFHCVFIIYLVDYHAIRFPPKLNAVVYKIYVTPVMLYGGG